MTQVDIRDLRLLEVQLKRWRDSCQPANNLGREWVNCCNALRSLQQELKEREDETGKEGDDDPAHD